MCPCALAATNDEEKVGGSGTLRCLPDRKEKKYNSRTEDNPGWSARSPTSSNASDLSQTFGGSTQTILK